MAGFLRKKVKDKPVPSSPIPLGAAPQPPPLFARFATSNKSDNSPAPRVVSSPKVLSGNVRKDQPQRRQPTPTGGAKKRSSQNQVPSKPPASVPRPLTPPLVVNNKPLPPPSPPASTAAADPSGSTPTQSFIPSNNNKQTRPPPPSVFNKNQPPLNVHVESNSFSSAQTSNSSPASRRPSTSNNNNSFTSPSKRNNSNTNLPPQILPPIANRTSKMTQQNPPTPPAFGRQNFTPTTAQTQMLHLSQPSSLANQDLQHPATNTVNNVNSSMSMIGASPTQISNMQQQQSEVSDRGGLDMDMDLPPEFAALFHNFNQQFNLEEEDRNSVHHSINSNNNDEQQHVPASNVPRSLDRPLINPDHQQHLLLPPLPPPKSTSAAAESDMGVASSTPHVIGNGYSLPSSTKDFYSPRVNGRTSSSSSYNNNSAATANQPQMTLNRRHSPPPPPPPPPLLPSVTASPPLPVKSLFRNEVSSSSNNRTVTHNRPAADPNYLQNPSRSPSSPRKKSVVVHSSSPPVAGKPRIFAMTAQVDDEETTVSSSFSVGPPPPPYVQYGGGGGAAKKQQQQQQSTTTTTRTNGNDSFKPVSVVQPSTPPLKSALNHRVEQQQLPPTPPFSHKRGVSRLSRKKDDEDDGRPHTLVNGSSRNRKKDESKSKSKSKSDEDEEPRSQLQNGLLQPHTSGSRSRKDLISILDEEPPRPVSQHIPPPPPSPGSRRSSSRKELKLEEQQRPRTPSRTRKSSSKPRPAEVVSQYSSNNHNSDDVVLPGTPDSHQRSMSSLRTLMTKSHPSTPAAAAAAAHKPLIFDASPKVVAPLEPAIQLDEDEDDDDDDYEDTKSKVGIILDDDDPFVRVEGVMMLTPPLSSVGGKEEEDGESVGGGGSNEKMGLEPMKYPSISSLNSCCSHVGSEKLLPVSPPPVIDGVVVAPPTPVSPEEPRKTTTTTTTSTTTTTKKKKKKRRRDEDSRTESTTFEPMLDNNSEFVAVTTTTTITTSSAVDDDPEIESEPEPILPAYTIIDFLSDPQLLSSLLTFFTFYDWCLLSSLSKEIRILLVQSPVLRETILERYLKTVGYSRWIWEGEDPLPLSLQDLNDYMRGVSTPTHEYARVAGMYVHSLTIHPNHRDPTLIDIVRNLTASTRAYTRVILRLRAQAEKEAILAQQSRGLGITMKQPSSYYPPPSSSSSPRPGGGGNHSRVSSRAPSPTTSNGAGSSSGGLTNMQETTMGGGGLTFRSPLFRLRRAPLLRVFVPSPEGDWLSDKSVLGCEEECKRAGVMHLIRLGDVIWDVAVGDEGNVGRLVWDGSYLIDLDYTYTSIGDLPKYIPALAFPPSYFHRVIRTGPVISNPIVHMDISPWGEEIAMNLQLLQDRVRTETPQGAYHNVVRWVHRSSFVIRPGPARFSTSQQQGGKTQMLVSRISIPDTDNMFVDSGWHGTVVVETEGTNEALADLQERCGPGVFPPRSRGVPSMNRIQIENKKVFRVLREKSRPGEIWIKTVGIKERIM